MTTLNFDDKLSINTFTYGNRYFYNLLKGTDIFFSDGDLYKPYILRAMYNDKPCHPYGEIVMSSYTQLNGKSLTISKLKEVMDTSHFLIRVTIGEATYFAGKGILVKYTKTGPIILFMACYKDEVVNDISDITFFVSREVFKEDHKKIQSAVKDFMAGHTGDVTTTYSMSRLAGHQILLPKAGKIAESKAINEAMKKAAIKYIKQNILNFSESLGTGVYTDF